MLGLGTGTRRMRTRLARRARPSARRRGCARRSRRSARCGARPRRARSSYEGELVRLDVRPYGRAGQVRADDPGLPRGGQRGHGAHRRAPSPTASSRTRWRRARYIDEVMRPAIAEGAEQRGRAGADVAVADWVDRRRSPTTPSRRARTPSARSPSTRPCAPTTGSSTCTGSTRRRRARSASSGSSFDLAGMTALVTDEMLDEMAVAGTPDECRDGSPSARRERRPPAARRAGRGDRPGPDPRVPRRDPGDVRTSRLIGRLLTGAYDWRSTGSDAMGWTLFYMVVILKIPLIAALWLVW